MDKGLFITFEGIDGCGKTTAAQKLNDYLQSKGIKTLFTYEPGGCEWGKNMRRLLLHGEYALDAKTEALLFAADRAEHMACVIRPALKKGEIVICDRFTDSTLAYQGGGRGMDKEALQNLSRFATEGFEPDITFYLALPVQSALSRLGEEHDRMESEKADFFSAVAETYEELAAAYPERIVKINAALNVDEVWTQIREKIDLLLHERKIL